MCLFHMTDVIEGADFDTTAQAMSDLVSHMHIT